MIQFYSHIDISCPWKENSNVFQGNMKDEITNPIKYTCPWHFYSYHILY